MPQSSARMLSDPRWKDARLKAYSLHCLPKLRDYETPPWFCSSRLEHRPYSDGVKLGQHQSSIKTSSKIARRSSTTGLLSDARDIRLFCYLKCHKCLAARGMQGSTPRPNGSFCIRARMAPWTGIVRVSVRSRPTAAFASCTARHVPSVTTRHAPSATKRGFAAIACTGYNAINPHHDLVLIPDRR